MSRIKKRSFLILMLLAVLALAPAGRVYAADEETLDQISEQVTSFLGQAYELPDDGLDALRSSSSFYEIFVRSWYEDREVTGDFVEVVSSEAEELSDGQILVNSVVDFEKYTSDVQIYFDEETMSPVNYVMNIRYSMSEKMTQAAQNMAVGLIVVFVILVFLMFIIFLFRFITPKKKESKEEAAQEVSAKAAPAAEAPVPAVQEQTSADNDEEIAAVIAAAIAAASEEAPSPTGYVVRSVRRGSRSLWKRV